MTGRRPISTVFCVRPMRGQADDDAAFLVLKHALREVFGPLLSITSLPAAGGALNRAGLNSRTVYEFGLFGHGVVVLGGAPLDHREWLQLEVDALAALDVPLLACGLPRGFTPGELTALSARGGTLLARDHDALAEMQAAGVPATLGGPPALFLDRATRPPPPGHAPTSADVLVVVRAPADTPLPGDRRRRLPGELRDLVRGLTASHGEVRLLCQSEADRHLAAAVSDVDYVACEEVYDWADQLGAASLVVTFRPEAALVCAGRDTPFVHLAAGPHDHAALEAIGLSGWPIDVESTPDLVSAVAERLGRLQTLSDRRLTAMPGWAALDRALMQAVRDFADRVGAARVGDAHRPGADAQAVRSLLAAEATAVHPRADDPPD
ncbi:MAG: hypothetical protein H6704_13120 [Myxococcales bacterium]|nr:hypothetical protein [Myxococcales bacterium]